MMFEDIEMIDDIAYNSWNFEVTFAATSKRAVSRLLNQHEDHGRSIMNENLSIESVFQEAIAEKGWKRMLGKPDPCTYT